MQLPADTIVIADRSTAGKILCSARRRSGIGYLVSIGGAREREPAGFRHAPDRLRLVFEDAVTLEDGGPSLRDIGQLIHFARRVDLGRGRVLVHCQSGISRSSAELAERSSVPYGREQERAVQLTDESDERGAARSHVDGGENMGRMKAMEDEGLPCLELLEATPDILRGLMAELAEEDARWKPAEDRFSVAEVLAHLSHSEGDCYRLRLDRFLSEERPEFEPDDAQMYLDALADVARVGPARLGAHPADRGAGART
jgi:hypothetical protein